MAEVIPQTGARDKVKTASAAAAAGDLTEAMGLLTEAYDDLFRVAGPEPSPVADAFGRTIRQHPAPPRLGDMTFDNHLLQISEVVRKMQRGLRMMALGIDYWQFNRFQTLTPSLRYLYGRQTAERYYPDGY